MPQIISEERKAYNKAYYLLNKDKNKDKYKCVHNRQKSQCKECGGTSICEHKRDKSKCKDCGGSQICEHKREKSSCKECGGSQICKHKRVKSACKECGGVSICEHNRQKSRCKECGICICEHNKRKSICKECGGSQICEHKKNKSSCKECNPLNYLVSLQRQSIRRMLISGNLTKLKPTIEYLGCSAEYFLGYLQKKMIEGMTFSNTHIDHIKPVSRFNLQNEDEFLDCCHYTNLQPLLAQDNLIKHNKWNDTDEEFWRTNIKGKEYFQIYNPLD
jgi:hypothetical protein